ncbi:uncharacterized protein O3C94_005960 [Discoglossus pictus]
MNQASVTFEEVAVYFSEEEWKTLEEWQKELYKDVMKDNYQMVLSLTQPYIISSIELGNDPFISDVDSNEGDQRGNGSMQKADGALQCLKESPESRSSLDEIPGTSQKWTRRYPRVNPLRWVKRVKQTKKHMSCRKGLCSSELKGGTDNIPNAPFDGKNTQAGGEPAIGCEFMPCSHKIGFQLMHNDEKDAEPDSLTEHPSTGDTNEQIEQTVTTQEEERLPERQCIDDLARQGENNTEGDEIQNGDSPAGCSYDEENIQGTDIYGRAEIDQHKLMKPDKAASRFQDKDELPQCDIIQSSAKVDQLLVEECRTPEVCSKVTPPIEKHVLDASDSREDTLRNVQIKSKNPDEIQKKNSPAGDKICTETTQQAPLSKDSGETTQTPKDHRKGILTLYRSKMQKRNRHVKFNEVVTMFIIEPRQHKFALNEGLVLRGQRLVYTRPMSEDPCKQISTNTNQLSVYDFPGESDDELVNEANIPDHNKFTKETCDSTQHKRVKANGNHTETMENDELIITPTTSQGLSKSNQKTESQQSSEENKKIKADQTGEESNKMRRAETISVSEESRKMRMDTSETGEEIQKIRTETKSTGTESKMMQKETNQTNEESKNTQRMDMSQIGGESKTIIADQSSEESNKMRRTSEESKKMIMETSKTGEESKLRTTTDQEIKKIRAEISQTDESKRTHIPETSVASKIMRTETNEPSEESKEKRTEKKQLDEGSKKMQRTETNQAGKEMEKAEASLTSEKSKKRSTEVNQTGEESKKVSIETNKSGVESNTMLSESNQTSEESKTMQTETNKPGEKSTKIGMAETSPTSENSKEIGRTETSPTSEKSKRIQNTEINKTDEESNKMRTETSKSSVESKKLITESIQTTRKGSKKMQRTESNQACKESKKMKRAETSPTSQKSKRTESIQTDEEGKKVRTETNKSSVESEKNIIESNQTSEESKKMQTKTNKLGEKSKKIGMAETSPTSEKSKKIGRTKNSPTRESKKVRIESNQIGELNQTGEESKKVRTEINKSSVTKLTQLNQTSKQKKKMQSESNKPGEKIKKIGRAETSLTSDKSKIMRSESNKAGVESKRTRSKSNKSGHENNNLQMANTGASSLFTEDVCKQRSPSEAIEKICKECEKNTEHLPDIKTETQSPTMEPRSKITKKCEQQGTLRDNLSHTDSYSRTKKTSVKSYSCVNCSKVTHWSRLSYLERANIRKMPYICRRCNRYKKVREKSPTPIQVENKLTGKPSSSNSPIEIKNKPCKPKNAQIKENLNDALDIFQKQKIEEEMEFEDETDAGPCDSKDVSPHKKEAPSPVVSMQKGNLHSCSKCGKSTLAVHNKKHQKTNLGEIKTPKTTSDSLISGAGQENITHKSREIDRSSKPQSSTEVDEDQKPFQVSMDFNHTGIQDLGFKKAGNYQKEAQNVHKKKYDICMNCGKRTHKEKSGVQDSCNEHKKTKSCVRCKKPLDMSKRRKCRHHRRPKNEQVKNIESPGTDNQGANTQRMVEGEEHIEEPSVCSLKLVEEPSTCSWKQSDPSTSKQWDSRKEISLDAHSMSEDKSSKSSKSFKKNSLLIKRRTNDSVSTERKRKKKECTAGKDPFSCTICGKTFTRKITALNHKTVHTGEKPFECKQCGKKFRDLANLKIHMRTHTKEKPYTCLECGKSFSQSSSLVGHERTHTNERPFECDVCGKCFKDRSTFLHHKRIHTGEKPYACKYCGRKFKQISHVSRHEKIHTGEKPYECSFCKRRFADRSKAKKHELIHTRKND